MYELPPFTEYAKCREWQFGPAVFGSSLSCAKSGEPKKQRENTGIIPGSLEITAFDINGNFVPEFIKTFQDFVGLNDNIVLISNEGEISSILANGFVEQLGATNMHSLSGGIQQLIKENFNLIKN